MTLAHDMGKGNAAGSTSRVRLHEVRQGALTRATLLREPGGAARVRAWVCT